jgi:hypothetical protein
VFILEHYFTSKSFAVVREAFSNAYPDKEVPNKIKVERMIRKFRVRRKFLCLREDGVHLL